MSKALQLAELIRTRLLTAPAVGEIATPLSLTGLTVIVDRQKNITSEISVAVAKAKGTAIVILWSSFGVAEKNASTPRLAHRYNISVWSKPVISGDALAADDVLESVINRMWHWLPTGGHVFEEAEVQPGGLVPHAKFLIYDCEVVIPVQF